MGEVVGMAVSLCKKYGIEPRGVYVEHLDELKTLMQRGGEVGPFSRKRKIFSSNRRKSLRRKGLAYFTTRPRFLKICPFLTVFVPVVSNFVRNRGRFLAPFYTGKRAGSSGEKNRPEPAVLGFDWGRNRV